MPPAVVGGSAPDYGQESYADMPGGGGDVYFDRLYPEWMRDYGSEYSDEDQA